MRRVVEWFWFAMADAADRLRRKWVHVCFLVGLK